MRTVARVDIRKKIFIYRATMMIKTKVHTFSEAGDSNVDKRQWQAASYVANSFLMSCSKP